MVEQVVKAAVNNSVALDAQVAEEGPDVAGKWLRTLGTSERDAAANRGTAVHEAAASGRAVMHVEPELQGPLSQFYDSITVTGAKIILQEQQVWNLTLGYAGSLDIGIEIEWGGVLRRLVVDIKTGKAVYVDHVLQLMGYGLGEFVGKDDVEDAKATSTTTFSRRAGRTAPIRHGVGVDRSQGQPRNLRGIQGDGDVCPLADGHAYH